MALASVLLMLVATVQPSGAHVGAPIDAIDVHSIGTDGRLLESSVGLAWSETGDDWYWVCHEAITTPDAVTTPQYAAAGRRWLGTVPSLEQARTGSDAVYWTDDGCTWTAAAGLSGHEVPSVAIDPAGEIALAVTADEEPSNGVYRSEDGGQAFSAALMLAGHRFSSVVISEGASGTAMAGSVDADGGGWLHWSTDLGQAWSSHRVADGEVVAMALHPSDASQGWAVIDGVGVETLLHTDDAGASVEVLLDPEGFIADVAVGSDGSAWVAFNGSAFLHAPDGRSFSVATEAPPGLGVSVHEERVLLATRFELVNSALSEGTRAEGFVPVFSFVAFDGPLDCPADTAGAEVCAPLYPRLLTSLGLGGGSDTGGGGGAEGGGGDGTADGPDPVDSAEPLRGDGTSSKGVGGCGKAGLLLLLPFGLVGVRRRIGVRHLHAGHGTAEGEGGHPVPDGGVEVAAFDE